MRTENLGAIAVGAYLVMSARGCGGTQADHGGGELDAGQVAHAIRLRLPNIKLCYERGLELIPTLAGRVTVTFAVDTHGQAINVETRGLPQMPAVGACVALVIRATAFPRARDGLTTFSFPFNFSPDPTALGVPR